jgi:hypothetical protein
MADTDDIIQRIIVSLKDDASAGLNALEKVGNDTFERIRTSIREVVDELKNLKTSSDDAKTSMQDAGNVLSHGYLDSSKLTASPFTSSPPPGIFGQGEDTRPSDPTRVGPGGKTFYARDREAWYKSHGYTENLPPLGAGGGEGGGGEAPSIVPNLDDMAKEFGAATASVHAFRDAFHVLRPVMQEAGMGMGELGAIMIAGRAGIGGLAAAIVGTLVVALEKSQEAADAASERLGAFFGSAEKGRAAFQGLGNLNLGVPATQLAGPYEQFLRLQNQQPTGGGEQLPIKEAFSNLTKSLQADRLSGDKLTGELTTFIKDIRENGITSPKQIEALEDVAPKTAQALVAELQKEPGEIASGGYSGAQVTRALARIQVPQAGGIEQIAPAWERLKAAFEKLDNTIGGAAVIASIISGWVTIIDGWRLAIEELQNAAHGHGFVPTAAVNPSQQASAPATPGVAPTYNIPGVGPGTPPPPNTVPTPPPAAETAGKALALAGQGFGGAPAPAPGTTTGSEPAPNFGRSLEFSGLPAAVSAAIAGLTKFKADLDDVPFDNLKLALGSAATALLNARLHIESASIAFEKAQLENQLKGIQQKYAPAEQRETIAKAGLGVEQADLSLRGAQISSQQARANLERFEGWQEDPLITLERRKRQLELSVDEASERERAAAMEAQYARTHFAKTAEGAPVTAQIQSLDYQQSFVRIGQAQLEKADAQIDLLKQTNTLLEALGKLQEAAGLKNLKVEGLSREQLGNLSFQGIIDAINKRETQAGGIAGAPKGVTTPEGTSTTPGTIPTLHGPRSISGPHIVYAPGQEPTTEAPPVSSIIGGRVVPQAPGAPPPSTGGTPGFAPIVSLHPPTIAGGPQPVIPVTSEPLPPLEQPPEQPGGRVGALELAPLVEVLRNFTSIASAGQRTAPPVGTEAKEGQTPTPLPNAAESIQSFTQAVLRTVGEFTGVSDAIKALKGQLTEEEAKKFAITSGVGLLAPDIKGAGILDKLLPLVGSLTTAAYAADKIKPSEQPTPTGGKVPGLEIGPTILAPIASLLRQVLEQKPGAPTAAAPTPQTISETTEKEHETTASSNAAGALNDLTTAAKKTAEGLEQTRPPAPPKGEGAPEGGGVPLPPGPVGRVSPGFGPDFIGSRVSPGFGPDFIGSISSPGFGPGPAPLPVPYHHSPLEDYQIGTAPGSRPGTYGGWQQVPPPPPPPPPPITPAPAAELQLGPIQQGLSAAGAAGSAAASAFSQLAAAATSAAAALASVKPPASSPSAPSNTDLAQTQLQEIVRAQTEGGSPNSVSDIAAQTGQAQGGLIGALHLAWGGSVADKHRIRASLSDSRMGVTASFPSGMAAAAMPGFADGGEVDDDPLHRQHASLSDSRMGVTASFPSGMGAAAMPGFAKGGAPIPDQRFELIPSLRGSAASGGLVRVLSLAYGDIVDDLSKSRMAVTGSFPSMVSAATMAFGGPGRVRGPGSSTSDSIPALLSDGEYVHPAKAVAHYGLGFMDAVKNMTLPKMNLGGWMDDIKMAMGGHVLGLAGFDARQHGKREGTYVTHVSFPNFPKLNLGGGLDLSGALGAMATPAMSPLQMATGGPIPHHTEPVSLPAHPPPTSTNYHVVDLRFNSESMGEVLAPAHVAERLSTYSKHRQSTAIGPTPSWNK